MTRSVFFSIAVTLLACTLEIQPARAGDLAPRPRIGIGALSVNNSCCRQCDDYCRKPFPLDPCVGYCVDCSCYSRKPEPRDPCPTATCCPDDYVRKCPPAAPFQCLTPGLPKRLYQFTDREPRFTGLRNPGLPLW